MRLLSSLKLGKRGLHLSVVVLQNLEPDIGPTDTSEDHRYQVRRNARLHGLTEHRLLNLALLKAEILLTSLLLLLLSLVFLGPSMQPVPHRLLGSLPLRWRSWHLALPLGNGGRQTSRRIVI